MKRYTKAIGILSVIGVLAVSCVGNEENNTEVKKLITDRNDSGTAFYYHKNDDMMIRSKCQPSAVTQSLCVEEEQSVNYLAFMVALNQVKANILDSEINTVLKIIDSPVVFKPLESNALLVEYSHVFAKINTAFENARRLIMSEEYKVEVKNSDAYSFESFGSHTYKVKVQESAGPLANITFQLAGNSVCPEKVEINIIPPVGEKIQVRSAGERCNTGSFSYLFSTDEKKFSNHLSASLAGLRGRDASGEWKIEIKDRGGSLAFVNNFLFSLDYMTISDVPVDSGSTAMD